MYWSTSSGNISLNITKKQAASAAHPGPCDADVKALAAVPAIRRQLAALDPAIVAEELSEYSAWEPEELVDHKANLERLLWCACHDINKNST